jgi:glutamyl/glutaminyl-tRNA synthetase
MEFEETILEDLHSINIQGDLISHTSDHFDRIYELAIKLIEEGNAYTDNTGQEQVTSIPPMGSDIADHFRRCVKKDLMGLRPLTVMITSKKISGISPR